LPDAERQVVELAFFRGLSVAEIARLLDETDETICGVLRTAMVTLREQMRGAEPARLPVLMSP
jgi:DNA-directed RNA polymerase specialized sigma24 family protein